MKKILTAIVLSLAVGVASAEAGNGKRNRVVAGKGLFFREGRSGQKRLTGRQLLPHHGRKLEVLAPGSRRTGTGEASR
jgi:hypothetical protein